MQRKHCSLREMVKWSAERMLDGIDGTIRSQFWHSKCEIWCAWMAEETMTDRGVDAVKERSHCLHRLLDIYLKSRVGREPMHRAAVWLLHCHGASLDPLQVLEVSVLSCGLLGVDLERHIKSGVKSFTRGVLLPSVHHRMPACANCCACIGMKIFALHPNDCVVCYKCLCLVGDQICPVTGQYIEKDAGSRPRLYLNKSNSILS